MLDSTETKRICRIKKLTAFDNENNIDCCRTFGGTLPVYGVFRFPSIAHLDFRV